VLLGEGQAGIVSLLAPVWSFNPASAASPASSVASWLVAAPVSTSRPA
jgi:hypothetical protein